MICAPFAPAWDPDEGNGKKKDGYGNELHAAAAQVLKQQLAATTKACDEWHSRELREPALLVAAE